MKLQGSEIILQGKGEINHVLSSMSGHPLQGAEVDCKEFPLETHRDETTPEMPSEAEVAHSGLWEQAMSAKSDADMLKFLGLADTLGRFIIRVRSPGSSHNQELSVMPDELPLQAVGELDFGSPNTEPSAVMLDTPVSPII